MNRKLKTTLITLICGFSIQVNAQKSDGFILTGQFKGLPDGTNVYLRTQEQDTIAKATSKGERFTFKGKLPWNGRFHFIRIDTLISNVGTEAIFLENKTIEVSGVVGSREVKIAGSQGQIDYKELLKSLSQIKEEGRKTEFIKGWILSHSKSLVAPWFIQSLKMDDRQKAFDVLDKEAKSSYYGMEINRTFIPIKKGAIIPDIKLVTTKGDSISVLSVASKSKYTLIDCWASWCAPCRAEVPELKRIFAMYKDKGLNILGVSSDKDQLAWKKAIQEDEAPWPHGIETPGNSLKKSFELHSIPSYILIDSKGTLVAFESSMSAFASFGGSLRGKDLEETLKRLLGEYSNNK